MTLCVFLVGACDEDSAADSKSAAAEKKSEKASKKKDEGSKKKDEGSKKAKAATPDPCWKLPGEAKLFSTKVSVAIPRRPLPDVKSAKAGYTKSLEELAKAMTTNGKAPEFEPTQGVGDEASWYASMKQLSVRKDDALFHISITQSKDDKPAALELAKALADAVIKAR